MITVWRQVWQEDRARWSDWRTCPIPDWLELVEFADADLEVVVRYVIRTNQ